MVNFGPNQPRPFAAFDVDGTICQSSLLEAEIDACIEAGIFDGQAFAPAFAIKQSWKLNNKEGTYTAYLDLLVSLFVQSIAGKSVQDVTAVTDRVVRRQQVRRFGFPKFLIQQLRATHTVVAISGSPQFLVQPYLRDMGIDVVYGSDYEQRDGNFTGKAQPVGAKAKILAELIVGGQVVENGSIAVGDTMSDKDMLRLAGVGIMFNPSQTLLDFGRQFGLPMVLENKDRISIFAQSKADARYHEASLDQILAVAG